MTGMGDFSKGPCVGVCYYIKKRGIKLDEKMKQRMKRRKPCIGLCHIKKMRKEERVQNAISDFSNVLQVMGKPVSLFFFSKFTSGKAVKTL